MRERSSADRIVCRIATSVLLVLLSPHAAEAVLGPVTIDVPALFNSVQVVVLAEVIETRIISTEQLPEPKGAFATVERVELSVVRCYKPLSGCGASVAYTRRATVVEPQPALNAGEEVMAFLRGPEPALTQPNYWSVWKVDWMKSTLETGHTAGLEGKGLLQADIATGLHSTDPNAVLASLRYLQGFQPLAPAILATVRGLAESQSTPMAERLEALTALLEDPKPGYVALARRLAESEPDVVMQHVHEAANVRAALTSARDPRSLPDLVAIAESPVELWHYAALYGLRNLRNPKSVPALVKALDDPDRMTEYEALITLAEITHKGGDYGPGVGLFKPDPEKYIGLWKRWWESEGKAEYGSGAGQQ
jgi:hypothetical protein